MPAAAGTEDDGDAAPVLAAAGALGAAGAVSVGVGAPSDGAAGSLVGAWPVGVWLAGVWLAGAAVALGIGAAATGEEAEVAPAGACEAPLQAPRVKVTAAAKGRAMAQEGGRKREEADR